MIVCAPFDEIAELRLPEAKHFWILKRVTVIESEHGSLRERTVVNADARLLSQPRCSNGTYGLPVFAS